MNYDLYNSYKVIILGDPSVGKNELLTKFAAQKVDEEYVSTPLKLRGVSILKESIELKEFGVTVDLELWDIAGHPLHRPFFNGADGMLLVYDITSMSTFENIKNWYKAAVRYGLSGIPKILIGTNAHLGDEREIDLTLVDRLCEELKIYDYYEISYLSGYNVKEIFEKIADLIYRAKVLNLPPKNQKLNTNPYQGVTIKAPNCKLINPYWVDALDNLGKITASFRSYPSYIEIKVLKKKPLTKEEKRKRKERALLYFENERRKIAKLEKRVKLIKYMTKSEELKKDEPFIIIPSIGKSKTKEETKV